MTQPDRRVSPERRGGPRGDSLPQLGAGASGPGAAPQRGLSRGAGLPGRAGGGTRGGCEGARPGAQRAVPGWAGPRRRGAAHKRSGAEHERVAFSSLRYAECSGTERNRAERLALPSGVPCLGAVRSGSAGEEPMVLRRAHGVV